MSGKAPRSFCGTKNNPTQDDFLHFMSEQFLLYFTYFVFGFEIGQQGTPHLQFYGECKDQMRFKALTNLLKNSHIERRQGTPKNAAGYCKKGLCEAHVKARRNGDSEDEIACDVCMGVTDWEMFFPRTMDEPENWQRPFEHGVISQQGKRSELTGPTEMITEESCTLREVAKAYPTQFVKFHKGFQNLRSIIMEPRNLPTMPTVLILWGATGTGKTRDAIIQYEPDEPHYMYRPSNGNWWDGYDGEKKVIFDEFRGQMPWSDLLGVTDRNEFRAPIKGGFTQLQAHLIIFTSPCPPDTWYHLDDRYDKYSQFERRITEIIPYPQPEENSDMPV